MITTKLLHSYFTFGQGTFDFYLYFDFFLTISEISTPLDELNFTEYLETLYLSSRDHGTTFDQFTKKMKGAFFFWISLMNSIKFYTNINHLLGFGYFEIRFVIIFKYYYNDYPWISINLR